ncbi:MAG: hypothetical protein AB7J13_06140, partial [Pyrinomonadaceae bacterium]
MKTIFRYANIGLLLAVVLALGAVATLAQDPCEDAEGILALDAKYRENYNKTLAQKKIALEAGKQYLEKYGNCGEVNAAFVDYLKKQVPSLEKKILDEEAAIAKEKLYTRFNNSVKSKNWDEVYASGREILVKEPDQIDVVITLGSIGYDELFAGNQNFKYNDETIRYAKQAIAALESGKTSKGYGLFGWAFGSKERA